MQLLIHITNHEEVVKPLMQAFAQKGIRGASVVDCQGMLKSLNEDSIDAPSIFGGLRKFVNPDQETNKLVLVVLPDEKVSLAIDTIHELSGNLKLPNTGILFTLPITRWEGVSKE